MRTQTKYEEIILGEIRNLPPPVVPQAVKMLRSLRESVTSAAGRKFVTNAEKTGFCGAWEDDRPADEIIADIAAHRYQHLLAQGKRAYRADPDGHLKIPHLRPPIIPPVPPSFLSRMGLLTACILVLFSFLIPHN